MLKTTPSKAEIEAEAEAEAVLFPASVKLLIDTVPHSQTRPDEVFTAPGGWLTQPSLPPRTFDTYQSAVYLSKRCNHHSHIHTNLLSRATPYDDFSAGSGIWGLGGGEGPCEGVFWRWGGGRGTAKELRRWGCLDAFLWSVKEGGGGGEE